MKRLFVFFAAIMMAVFTQASSVTYSPDDSSIFTNPERGFITMLEGHLSTSKPYAVKGKESTYDGIIPADNQDITITNNQSSVTIMYDILGRPVNESYHGIVIVNGQKVLR